MPLPKALAAKLAKRGIISLPSHIKEPEPEGTNTLQEEIIAEDYDDTPVQEGTPQAPPPPEKFNKFQGWYTCPNKWNVYHECTPACQEHWKEVKEIDKDYNRKRIKMLIKYPIPVHWQEILDIGLRRYYYWNTETDLVAWLPPGHPKCRVSFSAAQLRKQMAEERDKRLKEERDEKKDSEEEEESSEEEVENNKKRKLSAKREADSGESSSESIEDGKPPVKKEKRIREKRETREKYTDKIREKEKDKEKDKEKEDKNKDREKDRDKDKERDKDKDKDKEREKDKEKEKDRGKEREKERRGKERFKNKRAGKKENSDALDPMDPAAYSECPRGTWASGLPERNEARTGVDSTATGPLFQMRPYPNPGAVLRANAAVNNVLGPKKPS